jgi:Flp pilus assembly protein TadG
MKPRTGSTLVESAIVAALFLTILLAIVDVAQALFFHQFLTDRVRAGARYAAVHTWAPQEVRNVVAFNTPTPESGAHGLFGLTPGMVEVNRYNAAGRQRVEVKVSTFGIRFISPWLGGTLTPWPFRAVMPVESGGLAE